MSLRNTVGLEENANLLFLEAKEAKSKLVGAEQTAKETELKIASRRQDAPGQGYWPDATPERHRRGATAATCCPRPA